MQIQNCEAGDVVSFTNIPQIMRNGVILRITSCSVLIDVEENTGSGWARHKHYIGCSTDVKPIGRANITTNADGEMVFIKEGEKQENKVTDKLGLPFALKDGKRGRKPALSSVKYPEGEFTVKDAAALNDVDPSVIANYIKKDFVAGLIKITRTQKVEGARGKPSNVYKKV